MQVSTVTVAAMDKNVCPVVETPEDLGGGRQGGPPARLVLNDCQPPLAVQLQLVDDAAHPPPLQHGTRECK